MFFKLIRISPYVLDFFQNQVSNIITIFSKLDSDLSNYSKGGSIEGSKEYNKKIHYLYEFNKSFKKLPKGGVKPSEVSNYFESNTGGDYMKKINQPDLFIGE